MLQYTLFVALAPVAAAASIAAAIFSWRRRADAPGALPLAWEMAAVSGWLLANMLELVLLSESGTLLFARLVYWFTATAQVAWIAFALDYTGKQSWLSRERLALFAIIPVLTALFALTNEWHHLIWRGYEFVPVAGMLYMDVTEHGPWFWVYVAHTYALTVLGALLILREYMRSFKPYRQQSIWLVIGSLTPLIASVIYVFGLIPGWHKDYAPLTFAFAGLAFAVGVFRFRLFDVKPVARNLLIDSMTDPMLVLDDEGRIVDVNPVAQRLIGLPAEKIISQPALEVLKPWAEVGRRFQGRTDAQEEISITLDGAVRWFDLRISTVRGRGGRDLGRLISLRDITARKKVEDERERLVEELNAYAHTVAHDLKNPLAGLVGNVDLIQFLESDDKLSGDSRKALDSIKRLSTKMASIVDELLLLASVRESQHVPVKPLDTAVLVADAQTRISHHIKSSEAVITLPETWPVALGYGPWIEEVWANYLSNAVRYGGKPPRVVLGADLKDGMIRFWVRDNGAGLTSEEQSRLFQPFTRLSEPDHEGKGHGLGLSVVRRIVTRLGGEVGVESTVGEGSLFYFTLPAAVTPPPAPPAEVSPSPVTSSAEGS